MALKDNLRTQGGRISWFAFHFVLFVILVILNSLVLLLSLPESIFQHWMWTPKGTLHWPHVTITGLIILGVSIFLLLLLDNKLQRGRFEISVLWRYSMFAQYASWSSTFWSSMITGLSMLIALPVVGNSVNDKTDIIASPGFFYAMIALWFAVFTFLNTLFLVAAHQLKIASFEHLLEELELIFTRWEHEYTATDVSKQLTFKRALQIVDYTPLIGSVTLGETNPIYLRFRERLERIAREKKYELRVVCYDDDDIKQFHEGLAAPSELTRSVTTTIAKLESTVVATTPPNVDYHPNIAVWRSNKIGSSHIIIAGDTAFQFIVKPTRDGEVNEIMGTKTQDVFMLDFLKKTYDDHESDAIYPKCDYRDTQSIVLKIDRQTNIDKVTIKWEGIHAPPLEVPYDDASHSAKIPNDKISSASFRIKLVKKPYQRGGDQCGGLMSYLSKKIQIPKDEFTKRTKTPKTSNP